MPHYRARHLTGLIKKTLAYSPIVGIFGHRQVGKTTMAEKLSKSYQTLDLRDTLEQVLANPHGFIENHGTSPFALLVEMLCKNYFLAISNICVSVHTKLHIIHKSIRRQEQVLL